MSYPFIHAKYDYGVRKGPVLAFVVHMAEGGNTVSYLANNPPRGVSVHYVIDNLGHTTRMLDESHASGSINPQELRTSDDADGFFGITAAKAVLGSWYRDPNSAVISLEIEGFAAQGPSKVQQAALIDLVDGVRSRHPGIGLLGHRDFTTTKQCPGRLIPWSDLGGHGKAGDTVTTVTQSTYPPRKFSSKAGVKSLRRFSETAELDAITAPYSGTVDADVSIEQSDGRVPHGSGFLRLASGGSSGLFIQGTAVDVVIPPNDIQSAVNAALDHVAPALAAATTALQEARPRP